MVASLTCHSNVKIVIKYSVSLASYSSQTANPYKMMVVLQEVQLKQQADKILACQLQEGKLNRKYALVLIVMLRVIFLWR